MPKSCEDLWKIGHHLNGLYSVVGSEMVESVYCDFTKLPSDACKYNKSFSFYYNKFAVKLGFLNLRRFPKVDRI